MIPECILSLRRSYENFLACQTQMVILVTATIINNIIFIIIELLNGKILQG